MRLPRFPRLLGPIVLTVLAAGCADTAPAEPELTALTPNVTRSVNAVPLHLEGQRLFRRYAVDFNHPEGARSVADVTVSLHSGGTVVPLTVTAHDSATAVELELPAGTAPGVYSLELVDAWGRTVTLAAALRVLEDCESETGPFVGDACDGPDSDLCTEDVYGCVGTTLTCSTSADDLELCDGVDNDCDPTTADGADEATLAQACDGADSDLCTDDAMVCAGAAGMQCSPGTDTLELCDGADNDCNAATADGEDEPTLGQDCDGTDSDLCLDDKVACNGAAGLSCTVGAANPEVCDGVDNDCDPSTADGASEPTLAQSCDGPDTDLCTDDTRICGGAAGMLCSTGGDNAELCDGVDNDCNPSTADGAAEPTLGDSCDGPDPDLCTDDSVFCAGAFGLACTPGLDNAEKCDGVDNDCDPTSADGADESSLGQSCDGPDSDLCPDDAMACFGTAGMLCSTGDNDLELCNGLDDDCNGATADGADEPTLNQGCDGPDGDLCNDDTMVCTGSGMQCSSGTTQVELCNGLNDDCNPATADGSGEANFGKPCDGPADPDTCPDGTWVCSGTGGMVCNDTATTVGCLAADVGTFVQAGATGTQTINHALGDVPKLMILWTNGQQGAFPRTEYIWSFGLVDQNRSGRAYAASRAAGDNQTWRGFADTAIRAVSASGSLVAEATVSGWTSTNFTLNWTSTTGAARNFQYLIVGGSTVQSKLVNWTLPLVAGTPKVVTGMGFQPVALLTAHGGMSLSNPPPHTTGTSVFGLGLASALGQVATSFTSIDGQSPTITWRSMQSGLHLASVATDGTHAMRGAISSLDADGFTVGFTTGTSQAGQVGSLGIAGVAAKAGCFAKSTAGTPGETQPITGVGFQPVAVLLLSDNGAASSTAQSTAWYSIGASTAAKDFGQTLLDDSGVGAPNTRSQSDSANSYIRFDSLGNVLVRAEIQSFDVGGFTVRYAVNNNVASDICYLAIGAP